MEKLEQYKKWLLVNGASYNTIKNYCRIVELFLHSDKEINEIYVQEFFLKLKETQSANTFNSYKNAIASYFKFIKSEIELPKYQKTIFKEITIITEDYLENKIIPTVELTCLKPVKYIALLTFMYYTGLRCGEIPLLQRKDFDLNERTVKVFLPKRKKEKYYVFTAKTAKRLEEYFLYEEEEFNAFNITQQGINSLFYDLKADFPEINFKPHLFRHSFITDMLAKGASLKAVADTVGHASVKTTERYSHLSKTDLKKIYDSIYKD